MQEKRFMQPGDALRIARKLESLFQGGKKKIIPGDAEESIFQ